MDILPPAFESLRDYKQFIIYVLRQRTSNPKKMDKVPIDYRTGRPTDINDSSMWMAAEEAILEAKRRGEGYGVGFVFTKNDPFFLLDIDNCYNPLTKEWSQLSIDLISALPGVAIEVSSSGKGLHLIGVQAIGSFGYKNTELNIEFYTFSRFVALTGIHATGSVSVDCSERLPAVLQKFFPNKGEQSFHGNLQQKWEAQVERGVDRRWSGPADDRQLIEMALNSSPSARSVFGKRASFRDLWECNVDALVEAYPSADHDCGYDESSADAALAKHLSFWAGSDVERIERLMWESALTREKWGREDYIRRTILYACEKNQDVLRVNNKSSSQEGQSISNLGWVEVGVSDIYTNPPKPPEFLIDEWLPAGLLTILSAHGGTGKSMFALQIAVFLAMGMSFMGRKVKQSRVLFCSAEDSVQVVRHRLMRICNFYKIDPVVLSQDLGILDITANPHLYEEAFGKTKLTVGYEELSAYVNSFGADLIIMDNASDTFDANENTRAHVRGFLRSLMSLGKGRSVAILLLAHIDKHTARGDKNSEGYSGSTAWHNSARSRWYLVADKEADVLSLTHQKSNHGKLAEPIQMFWSSELVLTQSLSADTIEQDDASMRIILLLIDTYSQRKDFISPKLRSPYGAYKMLKDDPQFPKSIRSEKQLLAILRRAEDLKLLVREEYKDSHRNKCERYRIA